MRSGWRSVRASDQSTCSIICMPTPLTTVSARTPPRSGLGQSHPSPEPFNAILTVWSLTWRLSAAVDGATPVG